MECLNYCKGAFYRSPGTLPTQGICGTDCISFDILKHSILSKTAKAIGGYVKPREKGKDSWVPRKGFDTTITALQMKGYVLITDFDYEMDKKGNFYGWGVARYATPEEFFGKKFADRCYKRTPEESYERLYRQIRKLTKAKEDQIRKFLG
ncbi:MAG: hypothetical protein II606_06780 [Erysipelotrichaceae bacterium]|nr:hypothetical protein [Erysipelotrichaceae bacterium]